MAEHDTGESHRSQAKSIVGASPLSQVLLAAAAPLGAFLFSLIASAIVLIAAGGNPLEAVADMLTHASKLEVQVSMINRATPLYISGVAAAIGFKMNLFNIGVEGQYRMAAIFAAYVGGAVVLPSVLHIGLIVLAAMVIGGLWGGLAGLLYTHRGVNEVIGTIMLNGVALGVIAWLVRRWQAEGAITEVGVGTEPIADSGLLPNLNFIPELFGDLRANEELTGVLVIAIIVGIAYYLLLNRTVFGYDLRASGLNPFAARAGGVPPRKMALTAMLLSGSVAGLVGLAEIFDKGRYDPNFVGFLGFNGIAVALLGRNNPVGIAVGALLWAFLDATSDILQVTQTAPKEIIDIMRGIILLTVVIGYEVVRRVRERTEAARTAARLAEATP
ncbi:MAG: ABC transporter permease [Acidimicrobiia bacterium]|nr:ABC transporter permease [Acidimicrobiia bacterium]MCY4457855.1 ABC transporter permease [Acidimicrobiaceae bacterium]